MLPVNSKKSSKTVVNKESETTSVAFCVRTANDEHKA